jgi:hypothetical protein
MPPAFVLSQDQTLRLRIDMRPRRLQPPRFISRTASGSTGAAPQQTRADPAQIGAFLPVNIATTKAVATLTGKVHRSDTGSPCIQNTTNGSNHCARSKTPVPDHSPPPAHPFHTHITNLFKNERSPCGDRDGGALYAPLQIRVKRPFSDFFHPCGLIRSSLGKAGENRRNLRKNTARDPRARLTSPDSVLQLT